MSSFLLHATKVLKIPYCNMRMTGGTKQVYSYNFCFHPSYRKGQLAPSQTEATLGAYFLRLISAIIIIKIQGMVFVCDRIM